MSIIVTYNKNDGSSTTVQRTYTEETANQTFLATDAALTRTDYKLIGWSKEATFDTYDWNNTMWAVNSVIDDTWIKDHGASITLYAVWVRINYTIGTWRGLIVGPEEYKWRAVCELQCVDANAEKGRLFKRRFYVNVSKGASTPLTNIFSVSWSNSKYTISEAGTYADSGWKSIGWFAIDSDISCECWAGYAATEEIEFISEITDSYTLTEKTTTYTVSFDANTGTGAPSSQTKTINIPIYITNTKPSKTGYKFSHWNTKADGTGESFESGGQYSDNENRTLYAIYAKQVTVRFNSNIEGDVSTKSQVFTEGVIAQALETYDFKRSGYRLLGWSLNKENPVYGWLINMWGVGWIVNDAWINAHSPNVTLYAVWEKIDTTIGTWYGPTVGLANGKFRVVCKLKYTDEDPERGRLYQRRLYVEVVVGSSSVITNKLSVSWSSSKYTISSKGIYADTGWTRVGWHVPEDEISCEASVNYTADSGKVYKSSIKKTYKAPVNDATYTITYDANGGKGVPSSQTKIINVPIVLSSKIPTHATKRFSHWNTKKDGSGIRYNPGDNYNKNHNLTLYAIWAAQIVTVTFDANDGSGRTYVHPYVAGGNWQYMESSVTREGYRLVGWSLKKNTSTAEWDPGYWIPDKWIYEHAPKVTLYAVWERDAQIYIRHNGTYKTGMVYIRVNGVYKQCEVFIKKGDSYKRSSS